MNILIVEDDHATAAHIRAGLPNHSGSIDIVADGWSGLSRVAAGTNYDLLIVDRMLPGIDGLTLVRELRATGHDTHIIVVSALGEVDSRVEGLEAGADDYLGKPFSIVELRARISSLSRRQHMSKPRTHLCVADLAMDLRSRKVSRGGQEIPLQPREFCLLEYLLSHAGHVVTRAMLLEHVWELHFDPQTSVIETHISRLRAKIDRGFDGELLHTVRGAGYYLGAPH